MELSSKIRALEESFFALPEDTSSPHYVRAETAVSQLVEGEPASIPDLLDILDVAVASLKVDSSAVHMWTQMVRAGL